MNLQTAIVLNIIVTLGVPAVALWLMLKGE